MNLNFAVQKLLLLPGRRGRLQALARLFGLLLQFVLQLLLVLFELLGSVGAPSFALAKSASGSM